MRQPQSSNQDTTVFSKRLSESVARAKLIFPNELEWRNWQTQQTQNLPPVTRRGGSTPPSSTKFLDSRRHSVYGAAAVFGGPTRPSVVALTKRLKTTRVCPVC